MVWLYYAKQKYKIVLLGTGIMIFGYTYLFGSEGLCAWWKLRAENHELKKELVRRCSDCAFRAQEIERWRDSGYLREKIAREELQLMRKGEEIYYIEKV